MKPHLRAVSSELPDPPYPSDTKAGSFSFDLEMDRIIASDTWVLTPPDVRPWLLMCWSMSWTQYPCGSWPNDDALIAARIGCDSRFLAGNRDLILRGWTLHSDGRLYHKAITEKVLLFLKERHRWKDSKKGSREKQQVTENVPRDSRGSPKGVPSESRASSSSSSSSSSLRSEEDKQDSSLARPKAPASGRKPAPFSAIRDLWIEILPELRAPQDPKYWTANRKAQVSRRWRDELPDLETWRDMFLAIKSSPFLLGKMGGKWQATFDWCLKPDNICKIAEGKYAHG